MRLLAGKSDASRPSICATRGSDAIRSAEEEHNLQESQPLCQAYSRFYLDRPSMLLMWIIRTVPVHTVGLK